MATKAENSQGWRNSLQIRHVINFNKMLILPFIASMMYYYSNYNPGCYLYLSLHGTYGLVWILQDIGLNSSSFRDKISVTGSIILTVFLLVYWYPIIVITSGEGVQFPSGSRLALCVFLSCIGNAIMVAAEAQKSITLVHKKGLITTGLFKLTRSPHFFGEILVYSSFAVCVGEVKVYIVLWSFLFLALKDSLDKKEASNSKKVGWADYKSRTFLILPKLFPSSSLLSFAVYSLLFALAVGYNQLEL